MHSTHAWTQSVWFFVVYIMLQFITSTALIQPFCNHSNSEAFIMNNICTHLWMNIWAPQTSYENHVNLQLSFTLCGVLETDFKTSSCETQICQAWRNYRSTTFFIRLYEHIKLHYTCGVRSSMKTQIFTHYIFVLPKVYIHENGKLSMSV